MRQLVSVYFLCLLLLPVAATAAPALDVRGAWAAPMKAGEDCLMVFVTIVNPLKDGDVLTAADAPLADRTELFQLHKRSDGIVQKQALREIEILPFSVLQFVSAGYELKLFNPKKTLAIGEQFPIFLTFERGGEKKVMVSVIGEQMYKDQTPPIEQ